MSQALKQRINDDIKTALLSGNRFTAETLRGLKAAILNEEVAKGKRDDGLDDVAVEQIIAKEIKKRHESAALYEKGDRQESADAERAEADVLQAYLPEQASEMEIQTVIDEIVSTTGATGPQAMGSVIGAVKGRFGSAADGATIARLVKETLQK